MSTVAVETLLTFLATQCSLDPRSSYPDNYGPSLATSKVEFDFIVVGAGSAGSTVAGRLAVVHGWNILLLEAGGYPTALTEVPGLSFIHHMGTDLDWKYESVFNNRSCLGLKDNVCRLPRGKCLGGSSSINGMSYARGTDADYNHWRDLGNPDWGAADVLKYFKKSEDSKSRFDPPHGTNGPLTTTYTPTGSLTAKEFIFKAAAEAGVQYADDEVDIGFFESLSTVRDGKRCSLAKAFLTDHKKDNLFVAINAHVTKVLIEENRATGVEVIIDGKYLEVKANKEVIVSGGALNSPQILMLSGIGPKEHLEELGIEVKKDLPVGQNLEDHCYAMALLVEIDPLTSDSKPNDLKWYCEERKGPLATIGTINMLWSFNTDNKTDTPNIQVYHVYAPLNDQVILPTFLEKVGMNNATRDDILAKNKERDLISYFMMLSHPKSRGWVKLRSANPLDAPLININSLSDPNDEDINTFVDAVPFFQKILETPTMKSKNAKFFFPDLPLCQGLIKGTDDYWKCLFRNVVGSTYHTTSTCKMGPESSPESVIDHKLRVYGIKNLRVIDASSAPSMISRNVNAMVVMIGEKGADLIKEDHPFNHV